MKILIADDSMLFRERLIQMIRDIKNIDSIGEAGNIADTLNQSQSMKPDVLLLDIHMPDGNGMDIIERVCVESPSTQVIIFTGFSYPQYRERSLRLGAHYFFDKNHDMDKMLKILTKMAS